MTRSERYSSIADMADADMAVRVKQYEGKLATLTAINGVLQLENDKLKEELEEARHPTTDAEEELAELKEEFADRLGEADAQVAKYKDECKKLRAQLQLADKGGSASSARLAEKDQVIEKLRAEGETLSRKNGELDVQVRKLRSSEREREAERDRLAGRVQALEAQVVQLNETCDRSTVEAQQQAEGLERELDEERRAHGKELAGLREELRRQSETLEAEQRQGREEQLQSAVQREAALTESLQAVRDILARSQDEWDAKENNLQRELSRLQDALREAEAARDEQHYKGSEATKPLLKQIEAMAAQQAAREQAQVALERSLTIRVKELEESLGAAAEAERNARRRASASEAAVSASKSAAEAAVLAAAEVRAKLDSEAKKSLALQAEKESLRQQLEVAGKDFLAERTKFEAAQKELREQLWEAEQRVRNLSAERDDAVQRLSAAWESGADSWGGGADVPVPPSKPIITGMNGGDPLPPSPAEVAPEDDFDRMLKSVDSNAISQTEKSAGVGRALSQASIDARIDILTSQLAEMQRQRDYHAEELCHAIERADAAETDASAARELKQEEAVIQGKLNICLEILGERNEKIEQLQDDIRDMKRIFHEQLNLCVDQLTAARREADMLKAGHSSSGG